MAKYKNLAYIFLWIVMLFWLVLIFKLSSQELEQSIELSSRVTAVFIKIAKKIVPERAVQIDIEMLCHLVRKKAHFLVYFILGILFMGIMKRSKIYGVKRVAITLLFCYFCAIFDEIHQSFVPGRGGELKDVFIDVVGSAIGILAYLGISKITNIW